MATWQDRLRDAHRFWEVAEAVFGPDHANQAASNAILAAIAANDAICLHLGRRQPAGESHAEATRVLQEVCRGTVWEGEAAGHARQLAEVIRHKNAAQYHGRPLTTEAVEKILKQVQRFLEWAEGLLPSK